MGNVAPPALALTGAMAELGYWGALGMDEALRNQSVVGPGRL